MLHHVLIYMVDLYLVLPALNSLPQMFNFENSATSKIDDVITEHGGLLHVLPLAVHLIRVLNWVRLGWGWA